MRLAAHGKPSTRGKQAWAATLCALGVTLGLALGGCAAARKILPAKILPSAGPELVLSPRTNPNTYDERARFFFVEYLQASAGTTRRVAVLAEPAAGALAMILNPGRYTTGGTGVASLKKMVRRYHPLRLYQIRDTGGKPLGYAFLLPGVGLRPLSRDRGRYTLELTGR